MFKQINKSKRTVICLLIFFLIIRIIIAIFLGKKDIYSDAVGYNCYANAILYKVDWLTNPNFFGDFRLPGYPLFIASIYKIFGVNNYIAVYIMQAIISTLTCLYIYLLSDKLFGKKVALISLVWSGIYVFYLKYVGFLRRETLIFFLFFLTFYYCYKYIIQNTFNLKLFCLSVLFYSILIHTDSRFLFYLPFLISIFLFYNSFLIALKKYFLFVALIILLLIPWTIRNYFAYDGFVLLSTRTLDLRLEDNKNPEFSSSNEIDTMAPRLRSTFYFGKETKQLRRDGYPSDDERVIIKRGLNPNNRSDSEIKAIKNNVYPDSTYFARKWYYFIQLWKPFDFARSYRPFPDARFNDIWSIRANVGIMICYGLLLPFMIYGIYFLVRTKNRIWFFLTFPLVIHTLLHVLEHSRNRFRISIDSFIIILGSLGIYLIYCKLARIKNSNNLNNSS